MLALLFAASLSGPAHAACAVEQVKRSDGVTIVIRALEEPVGCRRITLESDRPVTLAADLWSPGERRTRLRGDHLRLLPGGGWEIGVPELVAGGRAVLEVGVPGDALTVKLGPAEPPKLDAVVHETRTLRLDARHPGWGFADEARATTLVELKLTFPPEAAAQIVPLPRGATEVAAPGLTQVPLGLAVPGGTKEATVRYVVRGAEPLVARTLNPGSLTLLAPGVEWVPSPGDGVTATPIEGGLRFDAPAGGIARWRVARAGGDIVVPDVATYVRGLDWRFARVSLPEPAVPVGIRDRLNRPNLFQELLAEVHALRPGALPGVDPLRPRHLNQAWRSGWATQVEQALIFHRFLGQEKFRAGWALTGEHADPVSLTGFDTMLILASVNDQEVWVDPSCTVCGPGEIGSRWFGRPAIGVTDRVPRPEGRLSRALSLSGNEFRATFTAVGGAALWLRERIVGVEPAARAARLGEALGMPDAALVTSSGFAEAGAPLTLELVGPRPPRDPFEGDTPWAGGWGDELAAPAPATEAPPAPPPAAEPPSP